MNLNCIGLFGTCGKSTWREKFIKKYEELGIVYFNPQVPDWNPALAVVEAENLATDQILLFPITNETYATGSLAESGFSILNAIKLDDRRDLIIMISPELEKELMDKNPELAKESLRARALVIQHLKKQNLSNLFVVDTLEEMLDVSITLWESHQIRNKIKDFSIKKN
jgi:hypothetical protein